MSVPEGEERDEKRWIKVEWMSKRCSGIWMTTEIMEVQPQDVRDCWEGNRGCFIKDIQQSEFKNITFPNVIGSNF